MIGKANSINKIIQNGVGTAAGAVGILWVSEVSLDGLCGLRTYVNWWRPQIWLFLLAVPDICGVILDRFPSTSCSSVSPSFEGCYTPFLMRLGSFIGS